MTSNTVVFAGNYLCNTAVSLTGASTGSYVENNALEVGTTCDSSSTPSGLLSIASAATPGTTVDYNDLDGDPRVDDPLVPDTGAGTYSTVAGLGLLATTGPQQQINLYNQSTGHGDVILDVFGYFSD